PAGPEISPPVVAGARTQPASRRHKFQTVAVDSSAPSSHDCHSPSYGCRTFILPNFLFERLLPCPIPCGTVLSNPFPPPAGLLRTSGAASPSPSSPAGCG